MIQFLFSWLVLSCVISDINWTSNWKETLLLFIRMTFNSILERHFTELYPYCTYSTSYSIVRSKNWVTRSTQNFEWLFKFHFVTTHSPSNSIAIRYPAISMQFLLSIEIKEVDAQSDDIFCASSKFPTSTCPDSASSKPLSSLIVFQLSLLPCKSFYSIKTSKF